MQWLERIRAQRARFSWRRSAPALLGALLGSVMVLALLFTSLLPLLGGQAPAGAAPVGTATLRAPAATALASADKLAGQGDLYRAIARYGDVLAVDPRALAALARRAMLLRQLGSLPAALADYQKALQLNGEFWQARTNLALLHIERGEYAAAEQQLRSALRIQPANLSAQRSMVVALRGLQKIARPPAYQRRVSRETFFAGGVGVQHPLPFAGSAPTLANKAGSCLRRRPALSATPQQLAVCHATAKHWAASSLPYLGLLWTSR